jgi:hypothetical protein
MLVVIEHTGIGATAQRRRQRQRRACSRIGWSKPHPSVPSTANQPTDHDETCAKCGVIMALRPA